VLAGLGRDEEALVRFERFISTAHPLSIPARMAAAQLRFKKGDAKNATELLLPLLQRQQGAVLKKAARLILNELEMRPDQDSYQLLQSVRPRLPKRERRRLDAVGADLLQGSGDLEKAAEKRLELLRETRRDDAAALILARELSRAKPADIPLPMLEELAATARAQRDFELAERLTAERVLRTATLPDPLPRINAVFELARLNAARGHFEEAETGYRTVLAEEKGLTKKATGKNDTSPGTPGFYARVRFNLAAILERKNRIEEAVREFRAVEAARESTSGLAAIQRARIEIRSGRFDRAEAILVLPLVLKQPGRIESLLHLLDRRAETGDARGAARALTILDSLAKKRQLPEPWKSELPLWRGRVAESAGNLPAALAAYETILEASPYSAAGEVVQARLLKLPLKLREQTAARRFQDGTQLAARGKMEEARQKLTIAALLGKPQALEALEDVYSRLPAYARFLVAPDFADGELPGLCGDAAACRLMQFGLLAEADPLVRDARDLGSVAGCILASRIAELADAGTSALEASEAMARKVPPGFHRALLPRGILRSLAPRPFQPVVEKTAKELGVPAELIYAVMRQESRFDREAVSPAAARGLMQLTIPAAVEAAEDLSDPAPAYSDLYDPLKSIRLGAQTLKKLLDRFKGDISSTVAAYNAGPGQTLLWSEGSTLPAETLLGSINYAETRTYLRRVIENWLLYRAAA
jgi:predicted negative regulator of RcsB-dependent stress response